MDFILQLLSDIVAPADVCMAWVQIAALALSALGSAAGGISSVVQNRKAEAQAEADKSRNMAWYDRQLYSDPLKRGDNAVLLKRMRDELQRRSEVEDAKSAIMNGTDEARLARRKQNNETIQGVYDNIVAREAHRRDELLSGQKAVLDNYSNTQAQLLAQRQANAANLAGNAVSLAGSAIGAMGAGSEGGDRKPSGISQIAGFNKVDGRITVPEPKYKSVNIKPSWKK